MQKTVVITGANRGIGLAMAQIFKSKGYAVKGVCRSSSPALEALGIEVVDGVDVATGDGIARLESALVSTNIDVLVCNAGILRDEVLGRLNFSTIEDQLNTNALGPLRIVENLLTKLSGGKLPKCQPIHFLEVYYLGTQRRNELPQI